MHIVVIHVAGYLTQKEVGYISEVLILNGLQEGKNVLIDGSLRDAEWYLQYITNIKTHYPSIKIAIIHVTASEQTVLERCRLRGDVTGRHVPAKRILESLEQVPRSVEVLAPHTNFVVHFENEDVIGEPQMIFLEGHYSTSDEQRTICALKDELAADPHSQQWKEAFKLLWQMKCSPIANKGMRMRIDSHSSESAAWNHHK